MEKIIILSILFTTLCTTLSLWVIDEHLRQIKDILKGDKNGRN